MGESRTVTASVEYHSVIFCGVHSDFYQTAVDEHSLVVNQLPSLYILFSFTLVGVEVDHVSIRINNLRAPRAIGFDLSWL